MWARLAARADFWSLVDAKRIRVLQRGPREVWLAGSSYVGRAVLDDIVIEIGAKVEGALESLIKFASTKAFRVERGPSPASEVGRLVSLLAGQFVASVLDYASGGREWEYKRRGFVASLAGGRLDVMRTVRLRGRGAPHLLAFERDTQTFAVATNRVVAAALRQVEILGAVGLIEAQVLDISRSLSTVFEDCLDADVILRSPTDFLELADEAKASAATEARQDMLALAAVLLSGESFELESVGRHIVPRRWFLNLEALFERAVRHLAAASLPAAFTVERGSDLAPSIFDASLRYTANPDLVISHSGSVLAVADMKYKDLDSMAGAPDVYQLLTHAAAFRAPVCFLVYPGDGTRYERLGRSATGSETWVCQVDLAELQSSIPRLLRGVGISVSSLQQAPP